MIGYKVDFMSQASRITGVETVLSKLQTYPNKKNPSAREGYVKVHLLIHTFLKTNGRPEGFGGCMKKPPIFRKFQKIEVH